MPGCDGFGVGLDVTPVSKRIHDISEDHSRSSDDSDDGPIPLDSELRKSIWKEQLTQEEEVLEMINEEMEELRDSREFVGCSCTRKRRARRGKNKNKAESPPGMCGGSDCECTANGVKCNFEVCGCSGVACANKHGRYHFIQEDIDEVRQKYVNAKPSPAKLKKNKKHMEEYLAHLQKYVLSLKPFSIYFYSLVAFTVLHSLFI